MNVKFLTTLDVRDIDNHFWMLLAPFVVEVDGRLVYVPAGFTTDFASVPRLPLTFMLFGNIGHRAAVVHDYLCSLKTCTYQEAAKAFEACMREEKVSWWRRWAMTKAVLWFGPRF